MIDNIYIFQNTTHLSINLMIECYDTHKFSSVH
jgi:hypothetical protein